MRICDPDEGYKFNILIPITFWWIISLITLLYVRYAGRIDKFWKGSKWMTFRPCMHACVMLFCFKHRTCEWMSNRGRIAFLTATFVTSLARKIDRHSCKNSLVLLLPYNNNLYHSHGTRGRAAALHTDPNKRMVFATGDLAPPPSLSSSSNRGSAKINSSISSSPYLVEWCVYLCIEGVFFVKLESIMTQSKQCRILLAYIVNRTEPIDLYIYTYTRKTSTCIFFHRL